MSTHIDTEGPDVEPVDEAPQGTVSALWIALVGSVIFWIGLPFPVVTDFFESDNAAERIALIDDERVQFAVAFGLLGAGAAVAGVGLWMLSRAIAPAEARRSARRATAARVAGWFGLLSVVGGCSRALHAVLATPEFMEDSVIDPVLGGIAWIVTSIALVVFGVLAWSAPPPKWTAVVLILGGILGGITFLPLFWYFALIVFAAANLVVMRRRTTAE